MHDRQVVYQFFGYQDPTLAAKDVLVRVWIRFVERCPPVAVGFSIKIHGIENKEIMGRCRPDEWVTLEYEMRVDRLGRDHNFVILLFNGVTQRQEIQIAKFDVYADGKGAERVADINLIPSGSGASKREIERSGARERSEQCGASE